MHKVQFIGRMLPDVTRVTMGMPSLTWRWEEEGLDLKWRIMIGNSIINAVCELERYDDGLVPELYKRAYDLVRACANVVGFASGMSFLVSLECVITPDGAPNSIQFFDPTLRPLCTAFDFGPAREQDFLEVLKLVMADHTLRLALNDLVSSMMMPHTCPVNCGRVIDGIRRMITPPNSVVSEPQAWQNMQTALNVSAAYQKWITERSKGARHADHQFMTSPETQEILRRTWIIMNRFLELKKRDISALPSSDFPLLV